MRLNLKFPQNINFGLSQKNLFNTYFWCTKIADVPQMFPNLTNFHHFIPFQLNKSSDKMPLYQHFIGASFLYNLTKMRPPRVELGS